MRLVIFSGTSEGRMLCEFLSEKKIPAVVCVATEYGRDVMPEFENIDVHVGRLNFEKMTEFISDFDIAVDATHPYADIVTKNIRDACGSAGVEYIRLLRPSFNIIEDVLKVKSADDAVCYLEHKNEKVFVTTGSKELDKFIRLDNYRKRVYARVLPVREAIDKCGKLGLDFENIIFEKGPFSYNQNFLQFQKSGAGYLVTKESGSIGGFNDKIKAARDLNMKIIIIERPTEEIGFDIEEVKKIIEERRKHFF